MVIHFLFNLLCFQYRILSVEYFMDECTDWELNDILEYIPFADKNLMEGLRLNAYVTAQVNSTKQLKLTDICKYKWDEKQDDEKITEISTDDINRLREAAKKYES